jgi:Rrf2 family protein
MNGSQRLYSARLLSEELNINYKFLTAIMTKLVKAELIKSIRGREGGFMLLKDSSSITIIDIINIFDDSLSANRCLLGIDKCNVNDKCFMHDKWLKPKSIMYDMFKNTTLADIKDKTLRL